MKKLWLVPALMMLLACGSDKPVQSGLVITAPDGFAVACRTGFQRTTPHFCLNQSVLTVGLISVWADAIACTARGITGGLSLPANTQLLVQVAWQALSNNVIGQRTNSISFWKNSSCTGTIQYQSFFTQREFAAVVAGTVFAETSNLAVITLDAVDVFHTTQLNAGGNGNADAQAMLVIGYYD